MQNYHPLTVHLPLALLLLAAAAEAIYLFTRRPLPDTLSRWFLYLGALGAALAAATGWLAFDRVAPVRDAAGHLLEHRTFGFVTLGVAVALALWRWASARSGGPRPRALFAAALAALSILLFVTGREGGELVYGHGVGTALTAPGGPLAEPESAAAARRPDVPRGRDFR
jgi:uncharacterized membrane protein